MKKFTRLTTAVLLLFTAVTLNSCSDDDDNVIDNDETAYDFLVDNDNYSSLKAAVDAAGLTATLQGSGNFTIFAPDNDAFAQFLDDNDFDELSDVPVSALRNTLLYHVLSSEVRSTDLTNGYVKTSATNSSNDFLDLYVDADNFDLNDITIDTDNVDIDVDNGVIHAIDNVLTLPTVVTLAAANPDFSSLVTAVTQEGLVETLEGNNDDIDEPFTVFAPTNGAFDAFIAADDEDDFDDIQDVLDSDNLTDILLFHVVSGAAVRAEDIVDDATVTPINDDNDFTIDLDTTNPTIVVDGEVAADIVVTNVTANNGVIHAINNVLNPGDNAVVPLDK